MSHLVFEPYHVVICAQARLGHFVPGHDYRYCPHCSNPISSHVGEVRVWGRSSPLKTMPADALLREMYEEVAA